MVAHLSSRFRGLLKEIGLASAMLAIKYRVPLNAFSFLGMLERYDIETYAFFTPVGEIRMSPWEMQRFSGFLVCEFSYEEHIPPPTELEQLKQRNPAMYSTYWEVLFHFNICRGLKGWRRRGVVHLAWADYLFLGIEKGNIS